MYIFLKFLFSGNSFYKSIIFVQEGLETKRNGSFTAHHRCFQKRCWGSGSPPVLGGLPADTVTPLQLTSRPVATVIFLKSKSNFMSVSCSFLVVFACFQKIPEALSWARRALWAPVRASAQPHGCLSCGLICHCSTALGPLCFLWGPGCASLAKPLPLCPAHLLSCLSVQRLPFPGNVFCRSRHHYFHIL